MQFAVEHGLESGARNVAIAATVDGVTDGHVIGGDAFGDGAGGATDAKEPANDFLTGSDFGKGAIPARVQVDLESLVVGV